MLNRSLVVLKNQGAAAARAAIAMAMPPLISHRSSSRERVDRARRGDPARDPTASVESTMSAQAVSAHTVRAPTGPPLRTLW
jgi:hypothetical protein